MRLSQTLVPTLKEAPAEAEVPSHIFMVRGGYLRKVAAGIYSFLPLGWRVVQKIETIIREEMDRAGASEVFLPAVIPAELWKESGAGRTTATSCCASRIARAATSSSVRRTRR